MEDGRRLITGANLYLLRNRLDFLMLYAMMLRGESTREAELADLYSVLLSDESSEYPSLVLRTAPVRPFRWRWEGTSVCCTTTRRYIIEIWSSAPSESSRR